MCAFVGSVGGGLSVVGSRCGSLKSSARYDPRRVVSHSRRRVSSAATQWMMTIQNRPAGGGGKGEEGAIRVVAMPFVREDLRSDLEEVVARGAVQPLRPPSRQDHHRGQQAETDRFGAEDMAAAEGGPRGFGFWDLVPWLALLTAAGGLGYLGVKRFIQRQRELVLQFGEDLALYGNTKDNMREITRTFKKKLGPGVLRPEMFTSYVRELFTSGTMSVDAIEKVAHAKRLLKVSDARATQCFNELGLLVRAQPSVLGKILFVAERILPEKSLEKLEVRKMFRYGSATVAELQKSVLDRVYREVCERALDEEDATVAPAREADVLKLSQREADMIFQSVVLERVRLREEELRLKELDETSEVTEEEALSPMDSIARDQGPPKPVVHAYQCTECGYMLFPAAGREFKFFGSDFVCPQCSAPKSQFVDVNENREDE